MTIAEKLATIAENEPKIYEEGKKSMIDESKIVEKTASGTNIVVIDDTSEIPHDVTVKLTSDTVTDFSEISVTRYGANLFDCLNEPSYENDYGNDAAKIVNRTETSMTLQKTNDTTYEYAQFALPDSLIGQKITVYAEWTTSGDNTGMIRVNWDTKLESSAIIAKSSTSGVSGSGVVTEKPSNAAHLALLLYAGTGSGAVVGDEVYYKNIMVNVGDKTLVFEPCKKQTIQANADGTVDGITSLCPVMTLSTDVTGVEITANYHKSWGKQAYHDEFWDKIQPEGARAGASSFAGPQWNDETFTPIRDIVLSTGWHGNCFYQTGITDLSYALEKAGVVLDTSNVTSSASMFMNASVTRIPCIDLSNCATISNFCMAASSLHTIDKLIFSEKLTSVTNTFSCKSLVNIVIEGVIACSGFTFKSATLLSKESITSIINALSTTTTDKSIMLSQTAVDTAFETSEGAADGSTSDESEWQTLAASKSNWTINLS